GRTDRRRRMARGGLPRPLVNKLLRAFFMVWDGLRPDQVTPDLTPNLWRLAENGVWCERSYAVYPSLTRANSPAISTGCRPGKAGVPGNTFLLRAADHSLDSHSSGDFASLQ